jgi:Domain of unknown function (DUF1851)
MSGNVHDYLIDQDGIDWSTTLSDWSWLLPSEFACWLVNRFCDLFIVPADGTVLKLDVGCGSLEKVAESRDDFCTRIDEADNGDDWLMIPLVDELVAAGVRLKPGECYGFKIPPVVGGEYDLQNIAPISIPDYLAAFGSIHEQIKDLPDGAQIQFEIINRPSPSP